MSRAPRLDREPSINRIRLLARSHNPAIADGTTVIDNMDDITSIREMEGVIDSA